MEYWHDIQTEKSWNVLKEMKGKFPFILIGGWAVYLWTRSQKSKDIDIIIDFNTLAKLKESFDLRKNDKMRKYEIKEGDIDVDVYVKHFSELALPLDKIASTKIEGFSVAKPEFLLALKQAAELDRKESEKGEKDRIDIMSMLLKCDIDFKKYFSLLGSRKEEFVHRFLSIVRTSKDPTYFGMSPRQFKLAKEDIIRKIRSLH